MADTLEWMNKHLVLLRYLTVTEAVEKEKYAKRPDLAAYFQGSDQAERVIFSFAEGGDYKSACELMAYVAHKRAAVWWVYRCLVNLNEELAVSPVKERDIADIGTSFEPTVPDFAKIDLPKPDPAQLAALDGALKEQQAKNAALAAQTADPQMLKLVQDAVEVAFQTFKDVHGIHPLDLLKKLGERAKENQNPLNMQSPIFLEAAKLKAQLATVQKETVDTIKAVLPPKVPAHEKKIRDDALQGVWRWIAAPDAENSAKCFELGNAAAGTPAGLLAFSAFWAFGDMMPLGKQPVPTPGGLASNGLVQTLLMCALHKGGTRKVKERYEQYFQIGMDVLTGKENWAEALEAGKAPHEAPPGTTGTKAPGVVKYEKWKMEEV